MQGSRKEAQGNEVACTKIDNKPELRVGQDLIVLIQYPSHWQRGSPPLVCGLPGRIDKQGEPV